ncbi:hypothetical protein PybrP1_011281 [[Pythium] brassicae (nom. inval.)]|nr:hypothetical protein PybrP1_011281 [[Pythium] brassicae (nom. inval.)]
MPSSTLTSDELERILASVSAPTQSDREAKRLAIKAKSEQRTAQWPNTLEAMRKKKDRWKKDKEEREEEARKKIDEEEAQLQREARTKQIERANHLLYEQTDRMKTLRSKQLLADVVHHRTLQVEEKTMLDEQDRLVDFVYDRQVLAKVLQGEEEEKAERKRKQLEHEKLARVQKQQLEEYKERYISELREEKRDGERTKEKAEQDLRDEQERERARKLRLRQAGEETQLANMRLKAHREVQLEQERLEDVRRDKDESKKQARDAKRDELQRQKREKAQARKQRMIDLATHNLVKLEVAQDLRVQNQSQEVRAKEDAELQARADRRAAEKEAINRSRRLQIAHKAEQAEKESQSAREMVRQWGEFGQRIERQATQEVQDERLDCLRVAVEQKQQADARRKTLEDERLGVVAAHRQSVDALAKENERFQVVAREALREAKQRGLSNVFPIKKALMEKRIDLLPASGFRI